MKLTEKQEAFAQALAAGKSQRDAYMAVYDCTRYKESSIDQCASRLAKNVKIVSRCKEIRKQGQKNRISIKEEAFIQALLRGETQRSAYKQAFSVQWKDETIDAKASHLFATDKIRARYNELRAEIAAAQTKATIMTREEVMEELSVIARQDIKDFINWEGGRMAIKPADMCDGRVVSDVGYDMAGNLVIKFHDKTKALKALADIYRSTEEKSEDSNAVIKMVHAGDNADV